MKNIYMAVLSVFFLLGTLHGEEYEFIGKHYVASFRSCDPQALRNIEALKEEMIKASTASGATVLSTRDYIFEPDGMTMVLLLSESHASIHTYPEHNACFIDLFTCGTTCSSERFSAVLKEYLQPANVDENTFLRD